MCVCKVFSYPFIYLSVYVSHSNQAIYYYRMVYMNFESIGPIHTYIIILCKNSLRATLSFYELNHINVEWQSFRHIANGSGKGKKCKKISRVNERARRTRSTKTTEKRSIRNDV